MALIPYSVDISHMIKDLQKVSKALTHYNEPKEELLKG